MGTYLNNLFNYARSLPEPFDKLPSKKIKVSSKYGDGTEATLCATVIKALNAVCRCMNGTGEGAVGVIDHRTVAEYKSAVGADVYHIVVCDQNTGIVLASVYDKVTEMTESYVANSGGRDGAAIIMALFPVLDTDSEFEQHFKDYYDMFVSGFPDPTGAAYCMAVLCDNVYRRVKDETCPAHVKVEIDKSGNLMRVSQTHLDSGTFTPKIVTAGEFTIFAKTGPAVLKKASTVIEHSDFVGKYTLHSRVMSPFERSLVPTLPEWYIIPEEVVDICKHAQGTTGKPTQMRNFLLRGPAGTGKTMGAKAIAAGLGLPYMKYTCSAGTEIFDFIGQIFPTSAASSTGDSQLDAEREQLKAMGGINYANVSKLMHLPGLDDMDYDPAGVFESLTGIANAAATTQDCIAVVLDMVTDKVRELSKRDDSAKGDTPTYTYVETDFIKALKYGYLVEIQEPTTIMQPGVLVGLNSLLEQEGMITLPTGEVITRHPDAVIVITTNVSYEGCRSMNQSFIDRMSLVRDIELPTPEIMAQRAMAVTGETDEYMVSQMVGVVSGMAEYCQRNSITDGSVGMRSLIDWIVSTEITGDVYKSALSTIISKATSDEVDRAALRESVLDPIFAPRRSKKAV